MIHSTGWFLLTSAVTVTSIFHSAPCRFQRDQRRRMQTFCCTSGHLGGLRNPLTAHTLNRTFCFCLLLPLPPQLQPPPNSHRKWQRAAAARREEALRRDDTRVKNHRRDLNHRPMSCGGTCSICSERQQEMLQEQATGRS